MPHATQSDIAKRLNVTRITVSKALRNYPDISAGMKKKVLDTAAKLGYTPNLVAQNLTSGKTLTLGVVIPDLENNFFAYASDSIIDAAAEKNYNVFVTISRENQKIEKLNIRKLIGMRVDGLLVCVSQQTNDAGIFKQVRKSRTPLVFFDRKFEGLRYPNITFDDRQGALLALEEIIQDGYTKIAHIAGYSNVSIGKKRCDGYKEALRKNGIKINSEWIIEGGFEFKDGYDAFMQLYHSKNLPEIIFAVNDRAALGVYQAAKEVGVNIPTDIGIVAYGFKDIAQTFTPTLSVINQNPRTLGLAAARMLIEEIDHNTKAAANGVVLEEEFLWNASIIRKKNKLGDRAIP
jgi:LacI family transcriptional regulator